MTVTLPRQALRRPRLAVFAALVALLATIPSTASAAGKHTAANWDAAAQRLVVRAGLMTNASGSSFAGAGPLSGQAASQALAVLSQRVEVPPLAVQADATVTLVRFDALLVDQLGLGDVAAHVEQTAKSAGLTPPSYFGTEVLARYRRSGRERACPVSTPARAAPAPDRSAEPPHPSVARGRGPHSTGKATDRRCAALGHRRPRRAVAR